MVSQAGPERKHPSDSDAVVIPELGTPPRSWGDPLGAGTQALAPGDMVESWG